MSRSSSSDPQSPWQNPPSFLTDLVLPLLSLPDLARFSSVCSQWRSLALSLQNQEEDQDQRNNLLSPLPLLLVSTHPHRLQSPSLFSPFEHPPRFYHHHPLLPSLSSLTCLHSSRRHLLLLSPAPPTLSLLNLLTSHLLPLPSPPSPPSYLFSLLSTPGPHSLLLATHSSLLFLLHPFLENPKWTPLPYPHSDDPVESAVFFNDKFYCKCRSTKQFIVVDPGAASSVEVLEMRNSLDLDFARGHGIESLVVCGGEVLLVKGIGSWWFDSIEFWLYRVDFEERVFAKAVEGIGDSMMFLDHCGSVSLRVGDGVGRGNRVYYGFSRCSTELVRAVDLETGYEDDVPEEAVAQYDPPLYSHCWLVPR